MVACALLGFIIERVAYRPLRNAPRLTALITAIGVSLLLENGGQLVFGPDPKFFPTLIVQQGSSARRRDRSRTCRSSSWWSAVLLMVALQLSSCARVRAAMRAVSFNHDAAALMGIDLDRRSSP